MALRGWIDQQGESSRGMQVIRAIAEHDLGAIERGLQPAPVDAPTICEYMRGHGERLREGDTGEIVRSSRPEEALGARQFRIADAWGEDLPWVPKLTRLRGGGRGNLTTYRLEFAPRTDETIRDLKFDQDPVKASGDVKYIAEPAKSVWWLRWLFIRDGFALSLRSGRGLAFLGLLIATMFVLLALAALVWLKLRSSTALMASDVLVLLMTTVIALATWPTVRALKDLALRRVVPCPDSLLASNELFAQLRCVRRRDLSPPTPWVSLVRISSTCTACGGTIELMSGATDFPNRLVGRCRDAPTEHVYSFDPTTHKGYCLR